MPIARAKSVDELYQDCRECDLVLLRDQSLADALDRRLEEPRFWTFAVRPSRLVAGCRDRDGVFEETAGGRGTEIGLKVHDFAEVYARDEPVEADDVGELHVEQDFVLPLTLGEQPVSMAGVVDLVHVLPDCVGVIDVKTRRTPRTG